MIHHAYDRNQRKLIGPIGSLGEGPFEIIGAAEEGSRLEAASSGWPDLNRRPVAILTDEPSRGCVSSHLCSGGFMSHQLRHRYRYQMAGLCLGPQE